MIVLAMKQKNLMTVKSLAEYLDMGERTVRRMMSDGRIPASMIHRLGKPQASRFGNDGRQVRFVQCEVDQWVAGQLNLEGGDVDDMPNTEHGSEC